MITTSKLHLTFFCVCAGVRYNGSMAHFNMWGEDTLVPNHIKKLRGQPREYKKHDIQTNKNQPIEKQLTDSTNRGHSYY